jgi:D-apionate oxidoisomerase
MQGPEADCAKGEQICREMFAPVMTSHRVTVEQMAILEPALSETVVATCMVIIREAIDEAVRRGVPQQAAMDFILCPGRPHEIFEATIMKALFGN